MTANDNRPPDRRGSGASGSRANTAALVAVMVIAGLLFWVVSAMRQHDAAQDCLDSGRHDCVPVDTR